MFSLKGSDEFDVYVNYYKKYGKRIIRRCNQTANVQPKNNCQASHYRMMGNAEYCNSNTRRISGYNYIKSLRYATYNSDCYIMAIANRSAYYYSMREYELCLIDIELCFDLNCPDSLRAKLLIRKGKCCKTLGKRFEMLEAIEMCMEFLSEHKELLRNDIDKFKKEIELLHIPDRIDNCAKLITSDRIPVPVFANANDFNPSASSALTLIYNSTSETDFIANRNIARGEILFIDEVYAHSVLDVESKNFYYSKLYCDYCLLKALNCIPCMSCTKIIYCSEVCRDKSWIEYHRWECNLIQAQVIQSVYTTALRIVLKSVRYKTLKKLQCDANEENWNRDPYCFISNYPVNFRVFRKLNKVKTRSCCWNTVVMVEFLKRANFFSHLKTLLDRNIEETQLMFFVGGLLVKHCIQIWQRSLNFKDVSFTNTKLLSMFEDVNQFDHKVRTVSKAICPTVSAIKHSCLPNCSDFIGNVCVVKATEKILKGNEIYRCYRNLGAMSMFYLDRKMFIKRYGLSCTCLACHDIRLNRDYSNCMICLNCSGRRLTKTGKFFKSYCLDCKQYYQINHSILNDIMSIYTDDKSFGELLAAIEHFKKILYPTHSSLEDLYKQVLPHCLRNGNFVLFESTLKKLQTISESRNGDCSFKHGRDLILSCEIGCFFMNRYFDNFNIPVNRSFVNYLITLINKLKEIMSAYSQIWTEYVNRIEAYLQTL